jgi:hypothetical protein
MVSYIYAGVVGTTLGGGYMYRSVLVGYGMSSIPTTLFSFQM